MLDQTSWSVSSHIPAAWPAFRRALSGSPLHAPVCVVMLLTHMFNFLMAVGVLGVIVFQIWLTVSVFRSSAYEREQKIRQVQLIWLLPVIGATLVFSVLRESNASEQQSGATADRSTRRAPSSAQRATPRRDHESKA